MVVDREPRGPRRPWRHGVRSATWQRSPSDGWSPPTTTSAAPSPIVPSRYGGSSLATSCPGSPRGRPRSATSPTPWRTHGCSHSSPDDQAIPTGARDVRDRAPAASGRSEKPRKRPESAWRRFDAAITTAGSPVHTATRADTSACPNRRQPPYETPRYAGGPGSRSRSSPTRCGRFAACSRSPGSTVSSHLASTGRKSAASNWGKDAGIDLVGLHLRLGKRPCLARVRHDHPRHQRTQQRRDRIRVRRRFQRHPIIRAQSGGGPLAQVLWAHPDTPLISTDAVFDDGDLSEGAMHIHGHRSHS